MVKIIKKKKPPSLQSWEVLLQGTLLRGNQGYHKNILKSTNRLQFDLQIKQIWISPLKLVTSKH